MKCIDGKRGKGFFNLFSNFKLGSWNLNGGGGNASVRANIFQDFIAYKLHICGIQETWASEGIYQEVCNFEHMGAMKDIMHGGDIATYDDATRAMKRHLAETTSGSKRVKK